MNQQPPGSDQFDDVDDFYRRASAADSSRPSESVHRAVLSHATRLADERASRRVSHRSAASRMGWRRAVFGTLAAAALAGLMVAPRFFAPSTPAPIASTPAGSARLESAPVAALAADGSAANATSTAKATSANASAPRLAAVPSRDLPRSRPPPAEPREPARAARAAPAGAQGKSTTLAESTVTGARRRAEDQTAEIVGVGPSASEVRGAAETGDLTELRKLLEARVDIDSRDDLGRTALMLATLRGHAEAVDLLLEKGADPNVADTEGVTPLQAAREGKNAAIAAALERRGAR